jgi:hypothetical protein
MRFIDIFSRAQSGARKSGRNNCGEWGAGLETAGQTMYAKLISARYRAAQDSLTTASRSPEIQDKPKNRSQKSCVTSIR